MDVASAQQLLVEIHVQQERSGQKGRQGTLQTGQGLWLGHQKGRGRSRVSPGD